MKWVCEVCGYVHEGEAPPAACPQCSAPASKFHEKQEGATAWADEHVIGVAQGVDPEIIEGLKANFTGECTEVGMYLAMSRQADREGLLYQRFLVFLLHTWPEFLPYVDDERLQEFLAPRG